MDFMAASRTLRLPMAAYSRERQARRLMTTTKAIVHPNMGIGQRIDPVLSVLIGVGNSLAIAGIEAADMPGKLGPVLLVGAFQDLDGARLPPRIAWGQQRSFERGVFLGA